VSPRICFARRWLFPYIERELGNGVRLHPITRHPATEVKLSAGAAVTADALALVLDRLANLAHIAA
jgi:hypothetical protein